MSVLLHPHLSKLSILDIYTKVSEVRWKGQGDIRRSDYMVYYSGGGKAEGDVAVVVHKGIVTNVKQIVCLKAEPVRILIVQVYVPTSECEDDKVEEMYDKVEEILEEDGKGETNTIIKGEWNIVVGDKSY
jgi:exonuclease III